MDTLMLFIGTAASRVGADLVGRLLQRAGVTHSRSHSVGRLGDIADLGVLALDIDKTNPMMAQYPAACIAAPAIPFSAIKTDTGQYAAAADIELTLLPDDGANGLGGNGYPAVGNVVARLSQDIIKDYLWRQCTHLSPQGSLYVFASLSSTMGNGMTLETLCLVHDILRTLGKISVSTILVILSNQYLAMDRDRRMREAAFVSALSAVERGAVMARPHTTAREHHGSLSNMVFFVSTAYSAGLSPRSLNQGPRRLGQTVEHLLEYEACYLEYCVASPIGTQVRADRIRTPLPRRLLQGQPPLLSFHGFSALDARVDAVRQCAEYTFVLKVLDTLRGLGTQPVVLLAPPPPLSLAQSLLQQFVAPYQEAVRPLLREIQAVLEDKSTSPQEWHTPIQIALAQVPPLLQQAEREASAVCENVERALEQQLLNEISLHNVNAGTRATRKAMDNLRQGLLEAHQELPTLLQPTLEQWQEDILMHCKGTWGRERKRKRVGELLSKAVGAADQKVYPEVRRLIEALLGVVGRLAQSVSVDTMLEQAQQRCRQELQAVVDVQERYPVRFAVSGAQLAYYSVPYIGSSVDEELRKAFWRAWQPTDAAEDLYQRVLATVRAQQYVMIEPDQLFETIYREVYRAPSDRQQLLDDLFAECRLAGEGVSAEFRTQHGPLADIVTICCPPGARADLDAYLAQHMPNQDGITLHTISGLSQIVLHRESHRCPAFAQHHLRILGEEYEAMPDKTPYVIATWAAQIGSYIPRDPHIPFHGFSDEELLWVGVCLGAFDATDVTYPDPVLVQTRLSLGPFKSAVDRVADDSHRQHIVQFLMGRLLACTTPAEITERFNETIRKGVPVANATMLHRRVLREFAGLQANGTMAVAQEHSIELG